MGAATNGSGKVHAAGNLRGCANRHRRRRSHCGHNRGRPKATPRQAGGKSNANGVNPLSCGRLNGYAYNKMGNAMSTPKGAAANERPEVKFKPVSVWSTEVVALLRQLVGERYSDEAIAAKLGINKWNVRSARQRLIGKRSWTSGDSVHTPIDTSRPDLPEDDRVFAKALMTRFAEGYGGQWGRKALVDLAPTDCRFPVGGRFCALPSVTDRPYCQEHLDRCCVRVIGRKH